MSRRNKTLTLENLQGYLKSSPTIVEYFLTIGVTTSNLQDFVNEKSALNPSVLSQFPPFNREETQIPEIIPIFCFPWGVKLSKTQHDPEVSYIMLTDESGNKLYCTSLKIWEIKQEDIENPPEDLKRTYSILSESEYFIPKCLVIVSQLPFYESFEEILMKLYDLTKITLLSKIEWFVVNLVAQIPNPPRGHTSVLFKLGDLEKEFKLPPMNKLPLLDLNLGTLFCSLSLENIMKVFLYLTLEFSLVFISNDDSKLSKSVISLLSLLFPFQWSLVCVPILPEGLLDYLYSPVSYIYGIASKLKDEVKIRGNENLIIIDLDNDSVVYNSDHLKMANESSSPINIPPFPPHYGKKLQKKLSKIIEPYKLDKKSKENSKKVLKFNENTCESIRNTFFQFFVSILKAYKKFLNFNNSTDQTGCFDFKKFIKQVPESSRPFFSKFLKTQMFANFCETRIRPQNIEEHSENLLFDETILAKLNRSSFRYTKFETPFVVDSTQSWKSVWKVPEISPLSDMKTYTYKYFPDISIESVQDFILPTEKLPKFQESIDFSYSFNLENKTRTCSAKEHILLCWLQMWAACLWYQDVSEHSLRYKELIYCLHELKAISSVSLTGIYKNLLEAVARINPSLGMPIFKVMTDSQVMVDAATIHLLQRILALSIKKDQKQVKSPNSIFFTNSPINDNFMPNVYRRRVFTKQNDSHIFAKQELCFLIKETCKSCSKFLNSKEVQEGWQSNDCSSFECVCTGCKVKYTPNLRVRIGLEIGHQQKTSNKENTIFFSPTTLKELVNALLSDPATKFKLEIELFRIYNANIFWNLIWHFNNTQLPFEFMLPYEHEVVDIKSSFIIVGEEVKSKEKVDKEVQTEWTQSRIEEFLKRKQDLNNNN